MCVWFNIHDFNKLYQKMIFNTYDNVNINIHMISYLKVFLNSHNNGKWTCRYRYTYSYFLYIRHTYAHDTCTVIVWLTVLCIYSFIFLFYVSSVNVWKFKCSVHLVKSKVLLSVYRTIHKEQTEVHCEWKNIKVNKIKKNIF